MPSNANKETTQIILPLIVSESGGSDSNIIHQSTRSDSSSNHRHHYTTSAIRAHNATVLPRKTAALSDDGDEGIDDILCVAMGIYDLPSPLDAEALAQLQQAVARLPAPQLRQVFIALVDALPEVPDQATQLWSPNAQAGAAAKGGKSRQWMCTRCFYTPTPHHHPWE